MCSTLWSARPGHARLQYHLRGHGGVCTGVFNWLLAGSGYVAPYYDAAGKLEAVQSETVQGIITFGFVGLETFAGLILALLLVFLSVEKTIGGKQAEIRARHGARLLSIINGEKSAYRNIRIHVEHSSGANHPMVLELCSKVRRFCD